jgi:F-type H+-transporting ATPase subunit delta
MATALANRYASALVDVVTGAGSSLDPLAVLAQVKDFEATVASSPELRNVLLSPAVAAPRKRAVIAKLAEPLGMGEKVRNFFYVLIDHARVDLIGSVGAAYETALDERLGRVRADISSAQPLSDEQKAQLLAELTRLSGRTVRPEFSLDASLVGGVTARIGSTIYDGSVRGRLEAMQRQLAS